MSAPRKQAWRRRRSTLVGVGVVGFLAAIVAFAITAQNGLPSYLPGVERTEVKAAFSDAGALRRGDDVRIADVRVGYVSDIALVDGTPVATMQLEDARPVYRDATAAIGARSALGQKYLSLTPGTEAAGRLPADSTITDTTPSQELDTLLDTLDPATRDAAASTIRNVGGGLAGRGTDLSDGLQALPAVLPDLGTVSDALSADSGAGLSDLLTAADRLSRSFAERQQSLGALVSQLDPTLAAVNTDEGRPAAETLKWAPDTLREARSALDSLNGPLASTRDAVTVVRPGAEALGQATPDLRGVLREAVRPLDKVPGVSGSAGPAVEDLTPTSANLQPLARQLGTTMDQAAPSTQYIGRYSNDLSLFFTYFADALKYSDTLGHGLMIYPIIKPESVLNNVPIEDPTVHREAYPPPGGTFDHYANSPIGERR
ncbi:MlaD family protein [Pseudonocardia sp. RS11V-5]|uniref:MlaD family protein n=1 Tax=Pseudonocardia terrae TaxID=2905831 RepID=UPI001E44E276|nr:MlaD family protein [Pseudonocardia terrae]MCE3554467.1 MlaD family protein [Pseudonocardia terrae]